MDSKLNELENQLKNRKEQRFYFCNTCSIEVGEEIALLNDFVCSECEEVYELSDNREVVNDLESKILKLKKDLELVNEEIGKEEDKIDKKKTRRLKKIEKEKKEKKEAKRKERAKKTKKKTGIKAVKKKTEKKETKKEKVKTKKKPLKKISKKSSKKKSRKK